MTTGYRKQSRRTFRGLPLCAIAFGPNPATGEVRGHARGILAIGDVATGWVAIGGIARGGLAFGGLARGAFAVGGLAVGWVCIGGLSAGFTAVGGLALGVVAAGGLAVGGFAAAGGVAVGMLAVGGVAVGWYVAGGLTFGIREVHILARDLDSVQHFQDWIGAVVLAPGMACKHYIHDLAGRRALRPEKVVAGQLPAGETAQS
jgi:hypothetical protein